MMSEAAAPVTPSVLGGAAPVAPEPVPAAAPAAAAPAPAVTAGADGKAANPQDPAGAKATVGAPEKYETFSLKEGLEMQPEVMEGFLPIAKELNLTQEQAQKLVDFHSEFVLQSQQANEAAIAKTQEDWVKAAKSDKEIGGTSFNENVSLAAKALKQFGTPELMKALDFTGVGNHPEFVRVFARIGKAISEDKFHVSNAEPAPTPKSWADRIFSTPNS